MSMARCFGVTVVACVLAFHAAAQSTGPDVTVSDLPDCQGYGQSAGVTAFAVGTTACNVGSQTVQWQANNNLHPVIAQNMYRFYQGRFEQIGQSWLKHGFTSTNSPGCGTCQNPSTGTLLGLACTDTYGAGLNGTQGSLGPRSEVNAATGVFTWPHTVPSGDATLKGRLNVHNSDLDPNLFPGARYFVEGHYVTADDATAGNKNNNATWREIMRPAMGTGGGVSFSGAAVAQRSAIYAWQSAYTNVTLVPLDIPGDGRIIVAATGWPSLGGRTHYEYAVYNMSSDRSVQGVTIGLPAGANTAGLGFHDVDSHSGEPYALTDWAPTTMAGGVHWATQTYAANVNANAIRWGTTYNFSFDSDLAPNDTVTLDLFKPGAPGFVALTVHVTPNTCPPQPVIPALPSGTSYALNNAVPYDMVDIALTGTAGPTGDDSSLLANLGFTFNLYGTNTTQLRIATNGYLCLPTEAGTVYTNAGIPAGASPNAMICPYWDDLHAGAAPGGGTIVYQTIGSAPHRRFIVEWVGIFHYNSTASSAETFEVLLDEGTNVVTITDIATNSVAGLGGGASATRGIEDPTGTLGVQVSYNGNPPVVAGTSVRLTPSYSPPPIPVSARLDVLGTGQNGTTLYTRIVSEPNKALILSTSTGAGPTPLPNNLGVLSLDLLNFLPLADGFGAFGPADPAAHTDGCGAFEWNYQFQGFSLPPGFALYFQGVVGSAAAPNGVFHLTNPVTFVAQ